MPAETVETSNQDSPFFEAVTFQAGGSLIGLDAAQVRASRIPEADHESIPDIEAIMGLPHARTNAARKILILKGQQQDRAISVGEPVALKSIATEHIHPLPALVAARSTLPGLKALAIIDGALYLLLSEIPPTSSLVSGQEIRENG